MTPARHITHTHRRWPTLAIIAMLAIIGACGRPPVPPAIEQALFGDHDLMSAVGEPAMEAQEAVFTLREVFDGSSEGTASPPTLTTSSRVLPGARGVIAFVQHDTRLAAPWRVLLHDQATEARTLVYQGTREIDSVSSTPDGNTVVFTARAPADDLEVFRLTLDPRHVERLTFTSYDETNVSLSADGSVIVWEGEGFYGQRSVYLRHYQPNGSFTPQRLAQPLDQIEPRLSSNGRYLALTQVQADGRRDILRYDLQERTYDVAYRTRIPTTHPSTTDDGNRVAFLLHDPGFHRVLIRDLTSGTLERAISNAHAIPSAHLASDGEHLAFTLTRLGDRDLGGSDLFTRHLPTGNQTRLTSYATADVNHTHHHWAVARTSPPEPLSATYRVTINHIQTTNDQIIVNPLPLALDDTTVTLPQ